jgi:hypothetical protein
MHQKVNVLNFKIYAQKGKFENIYNSSWTIILSCLVLIYSSKKNTIPTL